MSKIDMNRIRREKESALKVLEDDIRGRIFGQDETVTTEPPEMTSEEKNFLESVIKKIKKETTETEDKEVHAAIKSRFSPSMKQKEIIIKAGEIYARMSKDKESFIVKHHVPAAILFMKLEKYLFVKMNSVAHKETRATETV